ncbi:TetR/AcrR family transcriptional regulator [Microbacterium sp. LWH7-1.2]|uniref:TetR/AcrR family transcriptional regulator n=1 Tax=Microbacterium sp. LWH7-1.2 TaxID=3135257 RepID=UPI0031393EE2
MATTERGPTRAARMQRTREAIVDAAREAFVTRGYRATSLRDVAAAASISHTGLLRHFATKDALLGAVVDQFERANATALRGVPGLDESGTLGYAGIARRNQEQPGYLELFAALTGEASNPRHPAHQLMRDRYARVRREAREDLDAAIAHGTVAAGRDAAGEAVRIIAAWDGLQLLAQYLPERVDIPTALVEYLKTLALPVGWRVGGRASAPPRQPARVPTSPAFGADDVSPQGYRVGRERRALIIEAATALFARDGYGDTSLREIAERVGVSKSTLLHHFASKEELLSDVLHHRDRQIESRDDGVRADSAAEVVRGIARRAAVNSEAAPGLIEVYAVLSCEALPRDHAAHSYFAQRFRNGLDHFAALFRAAHEDGDLPAQRDPEFEALWLTALWDGLQYQWLYDPSAVDVAAQLSAHVDDVLPRR